jgi:hypothetical protein
MGKTLMAAPRLKPPSSTSPWAWLRVIYAVLALTVFAFPGGMVDWLDERNVSGWLSAPLAVARGVDAVSAATGVKGVGQWLRARFAAAIGDADT